jgi:hypothetical protein
MADGNEKKSNEPNWFSYEGMLANPVKWLESADILTAALSFMRPTLDAAWKEVKDRKGPRGDDRAPDFNLPHLTLWTGPVF